MIDGRDVEHRVAHVLPAGAMNLHDEGEHVRGDRIVHQRRQLAATLGRNRVVGIHPEDPVAACMPQRLIARGREIVAPGEVEESPAEFLDDLRCVVNRPGVDDHHFIDPRTNARQASRQSPGGVAHDHAQGKTRPVAGALQSQAAARRHLDARNSPRLRGGASASPLGFAAAPFRDHFRRNFCRFSAMTCPCSQPCWLGSVGRRGGGRKRRRRSRREIRPGCAQAVIVVVVTPDAELLIQETDLVDDGALDQQTETDEPCDLDSLAIACFAPVPREAVEVGNLLIIDRNLLRAADHVGTRADQAYRGVARQGAQHASQPAGGDDRVIVL